jgi:acyl carrier protein
MNRSEVEYEIRIILIRQLSIEPDQLHLASRLENDLSADSLDLVEVFMAIEERFEFTIPEETAARLKTLGEVVNHICEVKGIPPDAVGHEPAKNWPPAYAPAAATPAPSPAPVVRDCKSCGAHSVTGAFCVYCGRAL